jgi:hypothetical protein
MIKRIIVGSAIAAGGWAVYMNIRRWRATWGFDPVEATRELPGDELVPEPTAIETRGITIAAPPEAVWPWLVQMGYGRGGWYSYDALDMKGSSAAAIDPELQHIAVGDTMPTDPDGGFEVRIVEPERALVLYVDPEIVARRRPAGAVPSEIAPGVALSGRFLETATPPQFSAAWAFVLEPVDGGQTRLIERFRARMETTSPGAQVLGPALTFGIFVMTRRQMLGIKARAEKLARGREGLHRDVDAIVERSLAEPADGHAIDAAPATS